MPPRCVCWSGGGFRRKGCSGSPFAKRRYDHWLLALPKLVAAFALAARTPWVLDHDVALATDFERSLLDFKSSALGHAVLRDEGMPAELQAIAPQLRSLLERV